MIMAYDYFCEDGTCLTLTYIETTEGYRSVALRFVGQYYRSELYLGTLQVVGPIITNSIFLASDRTEAIEHDH